MLSVILFCIKDITRRADGGLVFCDILGNCAPTPGNYLFDFFNHTEFLIQPLFVSRMIRIIVYSN